MSKKQLWETTKELLKANGINTRGEDTSTENKEQFFFEKRKITNAVGLGKRR